MNPAYTEAWNERGRCYQALQLHEDAMADYSKALSLNPQFAQAYNNIGTLYAAQGKLDKALEYCQKGASLGDPLAEQNAASLRALMGALTGRAAPRRSLMQRLFGR